MKIDRTNYEIYFIDLLDGTLAKEEVDVVLDFIHENPDLAEELKGMEKTFLHHEFSEKIDTKLLLKSDFDRPEIFEEICVRAIENDLSKDEKELFINYVSTHPKQEKEYRLFLATISEPDLTLVYPEKKNLKKALTLAPVWYSIAAAFLIGFFFWFSNSNDKSAQSVAQKTEKKIVTPEIQSEIISKTPIQEIEPLAAVTKPIIPEKITTEDVMYRNSEKIQPMLTIANIEVSVTEPMLVAELMPVEIRPIATPEKQKIYPTLNELVAQQVSKFSLKSEAAKLGKVALNKISTATNEKLAYTTNRKGQIRKIEYNSKLLAFSFPVNSKGY